MSESAVRQDTNSIKSVFKKVSIRAQCPMEAEAIKEKNQVSSVMARVLAARGFSPGKELDDFLEPTLKQGLPDPAELKNLTEACELTVKVIKAKKPIAICCDFDVDGMSGGALLSRFLLDARVPNKVFVPDRFKDGYGLNESMVREAVDGDFGLLITVDYGTSNISELNLARELGIPTIVIDHHHVTEIPPADVFVNPQQDGCNFADSILCAAGLVWYFLIGLARSLESAKTLDVRDYLDLACLGTICDMVPLRGANRVIARKGLERLTATKRVGLKALKDVAGINKEVHGSHVGFGIGPRLNAAGRMIHGDLVIQLLTTNDSKKAGRIARRLNKTNKERQDVEKVIKQSALEKVESLGSLPNGIVVWDSEFHTGVIGIVAQRLVETFYRPSAVCGEDNGVFKGSVRGIKGFSVVEALSELGDFLLKFGGHAGAGGFSIDPNRIDEFSVAFDKYCEVALSKIETTPYVNADTEINLSEITPKVVDEFLQCAPFGIGNPSPTVAVDNLTVKSVQVLKGEHLKLQLSDGKYMIPGVFWKVAEHEAIFEGSKVRIAAKPEVNEYRGNKTLQLNIQAVEKA